jgi:hypothetical protein
MKVYSGTGPEFFSKFSSLVPSSYDDISCSLPHHISFEILSFLRGPFMRAKGFI